MDWGNFFATFVVLLRECLEAGLIVGIILTVLVRLNHRRYFKDVFWSVGAAVGLSCVLGFIMMSVTSSFQGTMEKLVEGGVSIIACGVLTYMIFWMHAQSKKIKTDVEVSVETALSKQEYWAFVSLPFFAVLREGAETVLFLSALGAKNGGAVSFFGSAAGALVAVLISFMIFWGGKKISLKCLFGSLNILLLLMASGLLAYGIHELQEVKIIPVIVYPLWNINHILNEKVGVGSFLKALFGYNGNPSLIEVIAYASYLLTVGFFLFRRDRSNSL